MGRKTLMTISGVLFVISIPLIALSHGYLPLVGGRLLQGISGGLIGVVVPLYLAECLSASSRGKGTGIFQWLLTLGIVFAALIGMYFSYRVASVAAEGDAAKLLAFKDLAWRRIFWVSLPPGLLFILGTFFVTESPRWLYRQGKIDAARKALLKSRTSEQAEIELSEMAATAQAEVHGSANTASNDSLFSKRYIIPFLLACVILACNQATGVNSIIGYNTTILIQAGLSDVQAHWGYVILTIVNFLTTIIGFSLVDRKGRKVLLSVGTAGIIVSLVTCGFVFRTSENKRVDCNQAVQTLVTQDQSLHLNFNSETANKLLRAKGSTLSNQPVSFIVIYSYGDFRAATTVVRSDDISAKPIAITREACVPANKVVAFFSHPFSDLDQARTAPLKIENALITPVSTESNGKLIAVCLYGFMAFFAVGPGVCVWLALSELMPTRIRSNGMSIALLINQAVSTGIAAVFLPTVGRLGYSSLFFIFAGCTVVYFITAAFFMPETKGKTLEEIEQHFAGNKS
jgi:MFS family permease